MPNDDRNPLFESLELGSVQQEVKADVSFCRDQYVANPQAQFWRRSYVKALFSLVDVVAKSTGRYALYLNHMKRTQSSMYEALTGQPFYSKLLSDTEEVYLRNEQPELKRNGTLSFKKYRGDAVSQLLFSFRCMTQVVESAPIDLAQDPRWTEFKKSVELRNEITHPRNVDTYRLSDTDMKTVERGTTWFLEILNKLHDSAELQLKEILRREKELRDDLSTRQSFLRDILRHYPEQRTT